MEMNLKQLLDIMMILWENYLVKWIIIYLFYILIIFLLFLPLCRKFLIPFINKTKTNLDNEIYGKIRFYFKLFVALCWLNIVYKLLLIDGINRYIITSYRILLTIEFIVIYIMIYRVLKIITKYVSNRYSEIITKNIANFMKLVIDIVLISISILLILNAWGVNITPLLASAGIFGLAVAMASKSIIENFLSWLILFADKSINVWDTVILSDWTWAKIEEINVRTTYLKTFDWNVIIIPNSQLLNEKIINKSLSKVTPEKRVIVTVWICYGDDIDKAKSLLKQYLLEIDWVNEETIVVYVDSLSDWSVNITWKAMVQSDKRSYLLEKQIIEKIYKEFPNNNLNFPFPTYEIKWKLNNL